MKRLLLVALLLAATGTAARRQLVEIDRTPIYRRSFTARYSIVDRAAGDSIPLFPAPVREVCFSPDSSLVAFVHENNLFVVNPGNPVPIPVTLDGERNRVINGATDWVYEEEYAFTRAWEWSPDSRKIAFLRFDESRVPEFSMMRYGGAPLSRALHLQISQGG